MKVKFFSFETRGKFTGWFAMGKKNGSNVTLGKARDYGTLRYKMMLAGRM